MNTPLLTHHRPRWVSIPPCHRIARRGVSCTCKTRFRPRQFTALVHLTPPFFSLTRPESPATRSPFRLSHFCGIPPPAFKACPGLARFTTSWKHIGPGVGRAFVTGWGEVSRPNGLVYVRRAVCTGRCFSANDGADNVGCNRRRGSPPLHRRPIARPCSVVPHPYSVLAKPSVSDHPPPSWTIHGAVRYMLGVNLGKPCP